jgi:hypothetical protein
MPTNQDREDRVEELELEVERLMREVDKYRTATEDALQQLDWCIGYFTGCNKSSLAKSLSANRGYIRRHILKREEAGMPTSSSS